MAPSMAETCSRIADSSRFQAFIFGVIVANAITLGLGTYDLSPRSSLRSRSPTRSSSASSWSSWRSGSPRIGRRPQDFFKERLERLRLRRHRAAFLPGLRDNVTLLRLARLLRVVRLVSVMPDLRILLRAMARSLPPISEPRPPHAAAHVRLRDGGLDPVPRAGSGAVGQHRRVDAEPVPDPHARELARLPRARARRSTRRRGSSSSPTSCSPRSW